MIKQSRAQYWDSMVGEFDAIYSGQGRTKVGVMLDRWLRRDIYDRVQKTVELVTDLGPNQRVLDVGCGTARLCVQLVAAGHTAVGVDFSESMLSHARQILDAKKVSESACKLIHGDVVGGWPTELDQYQSFDAMAMLGLLEYISDPAPMMQKLLKFKPKMIVATFCRAGTARCELRKLRYKLQSLDCPLFFQTEADVRAIAQRVGATSCEIETMGQLHFTVMRF